MFLSEIIIENYRAILRSRLSFSSSTIIIGENETGKSSIFEALQMILSPVLVESFPKLSAFHFHHSGEQKGIAGPIRFLLRFKEKSKGEWEGVAYNRIAELFYGGKKGKRRLEFEFHAALLKNGETKIQWKIGSPNTGIYSSDAKYLYWLRHINPVIYLSAGMLTGHGYADITAHQKSPVFSSLSIDVQRLVECILDCSRDIISDRSTDISRDIDKGYAASVELIERVGSDVSTGEFGLSRKIQELIGKQGINDRANLAPVLSGPGSTAHRLGVLLLVSALLKAGTMELMEDMDPIWIIENPEANVHPMTLSSITALLNAIKGQKIVSTFSGIVSNSVPLQQIRRLTRFEGIVKEYRIKDKKFSREDLRRIGYHLQTQHRMAIFARMWLLVEGESEFWILPQLARLLNYDFDLEGIVCMDFAQSGISPIIKMAEEMGIEWHLLADGDEAGRSYISAARKHMSINDPKKRFTRLDFIDIEHLFWYSGYSDVYYKHARVLPKNEHDTRPTWVIQKAIKNYPKPYLALSIVKAAAEPDSPGVPETLKDTIEYCIELARNAPANAHSRL